MKFRGGVEAESDGTLGVQYKSHQVKSIVVDLATDSANTTVTDGFPAFSRLVAVAAQLTTAVAGADATGFNLRVNGKTVLTGSDLTVAPATGGGIGWNLDTSGNSVQTTGSAGDVVITLTGGTDQIPTAGTMAIDMVFESWS